MIGNVGKVAIFSWRMPLPGPSLPSSAMQQIGSYLSNTGRAANVVATAALHPKQPNRRAALVHALCPYRASRRFLERHRHSSTGNRLRGSGLLSNALYDGRLVWNKVSMRKD